MSTPAVPSVPDAALQKAADILQNEDEQVVVNLIRILDRHAALGAWESKHTTNALKIAADRVRGQYETQSLEMEARDRLSARKQTLILTVIVLAGVGFLSWLFLWFQKPEFIAAILAGVFGFIGGYGTASLKQRKQ